MGMLDVDEAGNLTIRFPYSPDLVERARQVPGRWFDREDKCWRAPLSPVTIKAARELFPTFGVSTALVECVQKFELVEAVKTDFAGVPQPDWISLDLFPFQRAGVEFLKDKKAVLLCDEMGLGKTIQAIAWASAEPDGVDLVPQHAPEPGHCKVCGRRLVTKDAMAVGMGPVCAKRAGRGFSYKPAREKFHGTVVVCPASVKFNWEREIKRARPQDRVAVVNGKAGVPEPGAAEWVVLNYDLLGRELDALHAFGANNLVLDESHYCKNQKAQRTKAALDLAAETPRRLMVTGTPLLNRPVELWTQLLAAGLKQSKDFFGWARRYCGATQVFAGRRVGYVWDFSGASNLDELHESLKPVMIRRLKKDVLPDLPEITYSDEPVALENGIAKEYRKAQDDFVEWYASKGRYASSVEHLQQLTALRQLAVAGKVVGLAERLASFREEGKKAIVFCGFLTEGLDKLETLLEVGEMVRITGAESAEVRQRAVDQFQSDPHSLFALCSTMAAGVGITLTAADTVIFLDLPWTPGAKAQAEARAHRIGQSRGVQVIHLLAKNTVDEAMAGVLREKANIIAQAVDGQIPVSVTDGDVAREVSERLAGGEV